MSVVTTVTLGGDLSVHDARLLLAAAIADGAVDGPSGLKIGPEVLSKACVAGTPVRFYKEEDTAGAAFPRLEAVAKSLGVSFARHTVIESGSFPTISTSYGWRRNGGNEIEVTGPADQYGRPRSKTGEPIEEIEQQMQAQIRNPAAMRPLLVAGITGALLTRPMPELDRHFLKTIIRAVQNSGPEMVAIQRPPAKFLRQGRDGFTNDPAEVGFFTSQEAALITRLAPTGAGTRLIKAIDLIPDLMVDDRAVARERDREVDATATASSRRAEPALAL